MRHRERHEAKRVDRGVDQPVRVLGAGLLQMTGSTSLIHRQNTRHHQLITRPPEPGEIIYLNQSVPLEDLIEIFFFMIKNCENVS